MNRRTFLGILTAAPLAILSARKNPVCVGPRIIVHPPSTQKIFMCSNPTGPNDAITFERLMEIKTKLYNTWNDGAGDFWWTDADGLKSWKNIKSGEHPT